MWIKFSSVIAYQSRMKLLDIQHPFVPTQGESRAVRAVCADIV